MSNLLVTGGAGFIGTNFVHYWLSKHQDDQIIVLDALTYAANLDNLKPLFGRPTFCFVRGDIRDTKLVQDILRKNNTDTIVHFAAESHVDRSINGPDIFIDTNVQGTHSMLKAGRQVWLEEKSVPTHRFHHVSTDEVYGSLGPQDAAFHELTPYAPNSPYSASKAASDHLVRAYYHTYGLHVTTSNCSNNYGPYQFPEKLIPLTIVNLLRGSKLPIYGDGRNIRDWLHVEDHCHAIELILKNGKVGDVYNVGGGTECENVILVTTICDTVDTAFKNDPSLCARFPHCPAAHYRKCSDSIHFVADRAGHDRRYAIDCSKISKELGYQAQTVLKNGIQQTLEWYLKNESWWHNAS